MAILPTSHQTRKPYSPFILDENFELLRAELLLGEREEKHAGLAADSVIPDDLLSMSGYEKPHFADGKEFDTVQTMEDPLYLTYAQSGVSQTTLEHLNAVAHARNEQLPYSAGAIFQRRHPGMSDVSGSYASLRSGRPVPEITQWGPKNGPAGTEVAIYLLSAFELDPSWNFFATFGNRKTDCTLAPMANENSYYCYVVTLETPPFSETSWNQQFVPVALQARNELGNIVAGPKVGLFNYTKTGPNSALSSPDMSRKRKITSDLVGTGALPKRLSAGPSQTVSAESQTYTYDEAAGYLHHSGMALDTPLGTHLHPPYQPDEDQTSHHHEHASEQPPAANLVRRSPQHPPALNLGLASQQASRSPNVPSASSSQPLAGVTSPTGSNPRLVRTSSLQQSPSPAGTPTATGPAVSFNPYAMYPHKASLKIKGSLDDMTTGWSQDEREAQRRLVQFYRTQEGSTIHASFKAVTPEERQPSAICISCIWWEAKGECYVTSVDTISLLESLITGRFTVEEKNRIRRNLEGFRPLTVSKGKADSEDFFKLIMGFPAPKPRNIEKDVKAFPWKILDHALRKIISKYSASYASTAGPLGGTTTNYRTGYQTELRHEPFHPPSPYDGSDSGISTSYGHTPSVAGSNLAAYTANSRISVPYTADGSLALQSAHTPEYPLYQYPSSAQLGQNSGLLPVMAAQHQHQQQPNHQQHHHHHHHHQHHQQSQGPPQHRPSWDFGPYLEHATSGVGDPALYALPAGQEAAQYSMTHASSGN